MRILIIHNTYTANGGEDSVVANELNLLSSRHTVELLAFSNSAISQKNIPNQFINTIFNFHSYGRIKSKVKNFRPDIIHVHNFFYQASPSIFYAAKSLKVPIVVTLHNFRLICVGGLLLRNGIVCEKCTNTVFPLSGIRNRCFQKSHFKSFQLTLVTGIYKTLGMWSKKIDGYICLTDFIANKFMASSLNIGEETIFVKPNFVKDNGFGNYFDRSEYYLFIGRLSIEKGIDILLKAAEISKMPIVIVGNGEMRELVEEFAKRNENIIYLGEKSNSEIIKLLKRSKALVFTSICYEGLPMTILESFSTGTPVICSDIDNINRIVQSGVNGLIFKKGNPERLAEILTENKIDQEFFYFNARKSFETKYNPEINISVLEEIYQTILENKTNGN